MNAWRKQEFPIKTALKKLSIYGLIMIHFTFVAFAVLGGVAVLSGCLAPWLHLPALLWALVVEAMAWPCPLTQLENRWRQRAGMTVYNGGFVDHYLLTPLLGENKPRGFELGLTLLLLGGNLAIYIYWLLSA